MRNTEQSVKSTGIEERELTLDGIMSGFNSKKTYPQADQIVIGDIPSYLFVFKWHEKIYPETQLAAIIPDKNKFTIKLFVQLEGDSQRFLCTFEKNKDQKEWRIIDKEKVAEP